jgi:hypothetical protein
LIEYSVQSLSRSKARSPKGGNVVSKENQNANPSVPRTIDPGNQAEQELTSLGYGLAEEDIAVLAYEIWQARGCPDGMADEDWYQAVEMLRSRT